MSSMSWSNWASVRSGIAALLGGVGEVDVAAVPGEVLAPVTAAGLRGPPGGHVAACHVVAGDPAGAGRCGPELGVRAGGRVRDVSGAGRPCELQQGDPPV